MADAAQQPPILFRAPHPRHWTRRVTQRAFAKARNTVITSWVDVAGDIEALNRGAGQRAAGGMLVNGRLYGVKPDGRTFPISGPGFFLLGRGAYRALGVYNAFGRSAQANAILDAMGIDPAEREAARAAWQAEAER